MKNWIARFGFAALVTVMVLIVITGEFWRRHDDRALDARFEELRKSAVTREEINVLFGKQHDRDKSTLELFDGLKLLLEQQGRRLDAKILLNATDMKLATKQLEFQINAEAIKRLTAAEATQQRIVDDLKAKRNADSAATGAYIKRMQDRQATRAAENATPPAPVSKVP